MAYRRQIKCITKTHKKSTHDRISRIGGTTALGADWTLSVQDAIKGMELGEYAFYVFQNGFVAEVIIAMSEASHKYLRTERDNSTLDNLLSLPECPAGI